MSLVHINELGHPLPRILGKLTNVKHTAPLTGMYYDLLFTDGGLKMVSGAQPRSAVGCSVLFGKFVLRCYSWFP
ncbi:hypothetical protein [Rubritalea tangerina]|uniref:hypothetical protein n=1 Tax=Rubritalea tangerina TaxID=430798 RepID=UPI003611C53E